MIRQSNGTLWTKIAGSGWWKNDAFSYTAADLVVAPTLSPAAPGPLVGASQDFTWDDALDDEYYLQVGTYVGGSDYFGDAATSPQTVGGLPTNG